MNWEIKSEQKFKYIEDKHLLCKGYYFFELNQPTVF